MMYKNLLVRSSSVLVVLGLASSVMAQPSEEHGPEIVPHRVNPRFGGAPPTGTSTATSPILYHGGPVMAVGAPTVYIIWYGKWDQANATDTAAGQQIVRNFLNGIGGSPYFAINQTYSTGASQITGNVIFGGETTVGYTFGTRLSDSKVQSVVKNALSSGALHTDPNGVYFVLTSSDVSETSGFCNRYCGWHTHASLGGTDIKYSFVGNAARCITSCAIQAVGPNGNGGVDGMVSVIAHELEEATSDPDLNAWYDSGGAENADKCAWTFGHSQQQASNGAYYNVTVGGRQFEIQRNLAHGVTTSTGTGDYCATSYTGGTISQ
jgi:hypothetical protein